MKLPTRLKDYYREIGAELDREYLPPTEENKQEQMEKMQVEFETTVLDYYKRNIAASMAAEFIAHKLGLVRRNGTFH